MSSSTRFVVRPIGGRCMTIRATTLAALVALAAGSARADLTPMQCLNSAAGFTGSNTCTANDVSFVLIGLGNQSDGCLNASDTLRIQLGARLTTTATTRYDIGMWVNLDGTSARTATGDACARQILAPVAGFPAPAPPVADPLNISGAGPFRNEDNDGCGEIETQDAALFSGQTYNAAYTFTDFVTLPCDATNPLSGFVNIPTCSSWDQNSNTTCNNVAQALPGTSSKCKCDDNQVSSVPLPNLDLSCGCQLGSNNTVNCTVSYRNLIDCTNPANNANPEERYSCGTASYVRFETDFNTGDGDISSATDPETLPTSSNIVVSEPGGVITWNPISGADGSSATAAVPGSVNIVGANNQDTMSFTYQYTGSLSNPPALSFPTAVSWSNDKVTWVPQASTVLSCTTTPVTTPVTLAAVRAVREGDDVVVSWSTETETSNVGFQVVQQTKQGLRPLTSRLTPAHAVDSIEPQHYRATFPAALLAGGEIYIQDVSTEGVTRLNGPFAVGGRLYGHRIAEERIDWSEIRANSEARASERSRSAMRRVASSAQAGGLPSARLLVRQDGLYRVTFDSLAAAGLDFSGVQSGELALSVSGKPVPIRTSRNGAFGPGDYFEFVAQALDTLYTDTNVYHLAVDRRGALRIGSDMSKPKSTAVAATAYLETTQFESNREYSYSSPNGDPWYDTRLLAFTSPAEYSFQVPVDALQASSGAALDISMWGVTNLPLDPDHHVQVRLNGVQVADTRFDGLVDRPTRVSLPAGLLVEGANTLTLRLPGDSGGAFDLVNLESYAVTYPRAFKARNGRLGFRATGDALRVGGLSTANVVVYRGSGANLQRLENVTVTSEVGGYAASFAGPGASSDYYEVWSEAAVLTPGIARERDGSGILTGSAQYLIIAHPDFLGGLGPLVVEKEAQGLTVRVVDVMDVYAQYSGGVLDPVAIRSYIRYASQNLGVEYVLLVGGDSYDYRNFLGQGAISFMPSMYEKTSSIIRFAPVDSALADLDGDGVQDIAIGRFPVRTAADLDNAVSKTLAYSGKSYGRTAVFAADRFDSQSQTSFTQYSDGLITNMPADWETRRAYVDLDGPSGAKAILIDAVNGGAALTNYFGHSGPTVWSFSGLFSAGDAAALTNHGRPTVVSQWGCWNTYHVSPTFNTLGHKLLLSGDQGAAAVMGASTLTEASSDRALGLVLTPMLTEPGMTIGRAVLEAKQQLASSQPEARDVLLGFTILGDPALSIEP